jgi:hypothetical protein
MIPGIIPRQYKHAFIDSLETFCNKQRMSNRSIGYLIRAYHMTLPFFLFILMFAIPNPFVYIIAILTVFAAICFILFGGCWVSMLETRLCKDNFNIMDPYLELCKMDITNQNRFKMTLFMITPVTIAIGYVLYMQMQRKS